MFTALSGDTNIDASVIISVSELHPGNMSSGRMGASMVVTDEGRLYVLGGYGLFPLIDYVETFVGSTTTELWMHDLDSNIWALVSGSKYAYGEEKFSNDSTVAYPSSRYFRNVIHDKANRIAFCQGGRAPGHNPQILYSDEWIFNLTSRQWTYIRGHNQDEEPAIYGSYRVSSQNNRPGWRFFSSVFSTEYEGFLFGGTAHGDLWKICFSSTGTCEIASTVISTATATSTSAYSTQFFETTTELQGNSSSSSTALISSTTETSIVAMSSSLVLTTLLEERTSKESTTTTATTVFTTAEPSFETSTSNLLLTTLSDDRILTGPTMDETRMASHTTLSPALPETTPVTTPAPELTST
jgi:hypothetical protein